MHVTSEKFQENAKAAISDEQLQTGLFIFGKIFPLLREATASKLPEFEALRDSARDIKIETLNNLGTYLEAFEARVEEAGGRIHWARTADEANTIVEKARGAAPVTTPPLAMPNRPSCCPGTATGSGECPWCCPPSR